jgi:hypothetical protein
VNLRCVDTFYCQENQSRVIALYVHVRIGTESRPSLKKQKNAIVTCSFVIAAVVYCVHVLSNP